MSVAILACLEAGKLEAQTVLLCRSLRRYGGSYRDAQVYTFQPRPGPRLSGATLEALAEFGVQHSTQVLNDSFPDTGILNKVFVCAHAEEKLIEDTLVFVDSDTVLQMNLLSSP